MAYRRRTTARRSPTRRTYAGRSYRSAPRRSSRRVSSGRSSGVIRLVIEQPAASPVGRPVAIGLKEAPKPQKARL